MKVLKKLLKLTAIALVALIFLFFLSPKCVPNRSGKLRGNEYALNHNRQQMLLWKHEQTNSPNFDFWKLSFFDKQTTIIWGLNLGILFKTNFTWQSDEVKKEIVIICVKEFDNVPKSPWAFFLKNPAHAVGYSDGTTSLISPEQFTNLNLTGFVSVLSLATNSELNIFGK